MYVDSRERVNVAENKNGEKCPLTSRRIVSIAPRLLRIVVTSFIIFILVRKCVITIFKTIFQHNKYNNNNCKQDWITSRVLNSNSILWLKYLNRLLCLLKTIVVWNALTYLIKNIFKQEFLEMAIFVNNQFERKRIFYKGALYGTYSTVEIKFV